MVTAEEQSQTLAEEIEVLESIYIDELEKITDDHLRIRVTPEEYDESKKDPVLLLDVRYTDKYPDEVPHLSICVLEDERQVLGPAPEDANEPSEESMETDKREGVQKLYTELEEVANESLGLPMVFTLASHLRESLTDYMTRKAQEAEKEANEKREAELRAEEEKFLGTAVTVERFRVWREEFMKKQAELKAQKEEAFMATLSNKEKEEYKRMKAKPTGRELFSKPGTGVEEEKVADEAVKEVDFSKYTREEREKWTHEDESDGEEGFVDDMEE